MSKEFDNWKKKQSGGADKAEEFDRRLNTWMDNSDKYHRNAQHDLGRQKYSHTTIYNPNSKSRYKTALSQRNAFQKEGQNLLKMADQYRPFFGEEWYKKVTGAIGERNRSHNQILSAYNQDSRWFDQWKDEDEYRNWSNGVENRNAAQRERDTLSRLDLDKEKEKLDTLQKERDSADQFMRGTWKVYQDDPIGRSKELVDRIEGEHAAIEARGGVDYMDDVIQSRKDRIAKARQIQANTPVDYSDMAPDFQEKSQYRKSGEDKVIHNPVSDLTVPGGDYTYEYINNQDGFRDRVSKVGNPSVKAFLQKADEQGLDLLSPEEIQTYNYLYTQSKDEANAYLDKLEATLNQRRGKEMYDNIDSTFDRYAFGVKAGLDQAKGFTHLFSEKYPVPSAVQYASAMNREDMSGFGKFAYDAITTTSNMVPSILAGTISNFLLPGSGAAVGNAMMGASAAGNAYQDAVERGFDDKDARFYSALIGASEVGIGHLLGGIDALGQTGASHLIPKSVLSKLANTKMANKLASAIDSSLGRFVARFGGNMIAEGREEAVQEIIEPWLQNVILGADEKVNLGDVAYSALLGAVTAGLMNAPGEVVNAAVADQETISTGRDIVRSEGGIQNLKDMANRMASVANEKDAARISKQTESIGDEDSRKNSRKVGKLSKTIAEVAQRTPDGKLVEALTDVVENTNRSASGTEEVTVDNIPQGYASEDEAIVSETVKDLGIDDESSQKLVESFKANPIKADVWSKGIQDAFRMGQYNIPKNEMSGPTTMTRYLNDYQRTKAYELGQQSAAVKFSGNPKKMLNQKGGLVKFKDPNLRKENLNKIQKTSVEALEKVADAIGVNIVLFESPVVNGVRKGKNGSYDPNTNTIEIDLHAGVSGKDTILFTAGHELTHLIREWSPSHFKNLSDFLMEKYGEKGVSVEKLIYKQILKARESDRKISYDTAFEEVVADSMESMLADGDVVQKLSELRTKDRSLWEKIKSYISELASRIKKLYDSLRPDSAEGRYVKDMKDSIDRFHQLFLEGLTASAENIENASMESEKPMEPEKEMEFSLRYNDAYMEKAEKKNKTLGTPVSENIMAKAKADREYVANRMKEIRESGHVGLPDDIEGNTFLPDASYGGTEENSTVCPRSLAAEAYVDAVSEILGRPLTVREQVFLSQDTQGRTITPECLYCYVAQDRKAQREYLGKYIQQREDILTAYENGDRDTKRLDADYRKWLRGKSDSNVKFNEYKKVAGNKAKRYGSLYGKLLDGRKDTANMWKRFKMWIDLYNSGSSMIQAEDLANMTKLIEDIDSGKFTGDLKFQIEDAWDYAQKASWAKKRLSFLAYNGHILKWQKSRIDKLNSQYGLRMYSFSDYSPAFLLENMQMVTDAAVRGLKGLAYTKDMDFARIFAPTGMNINISTFGFESGGGVYENSIIGASWEEAKNLRSKYGNVGVTFVATSDNLVNWALEQDWIDVVIPYHMVKTGEVVASELGYTNYTRESSDVKVRGSHTKNDESMIAPPEHDNDFEKYMEALKKNHLKPRFERFIGNPNYMKLVNECRQPASKSNPIQPVFDMTAAKESLAKLAVNGYYTPIGGSVDAMYDIAMKAANKIESGDLKLSDRSVSEIPDSDYKKLESHFGITRNYDVAGYLLRDGNMLDFSGKHWGDPHSTTRQVDHRDIWEVWENPDRDGTDEMVNMISNGNIRLAPENGGINLAVVPNDNQFKALRGYINHFRGEVVVDIDAYGGDTIHSFEYNRGTSSSKIISDIKEYFESGKVPEKENPSGVDLSQFRYSDRDYMVAVDSGNMEEAQRMVGEAAKKAGYNTPPLFHGSPKFGFTVFDPKMSKDGISIFSTTDPSIAQTYSGQFGVKYISDDGKLKKFTDRVDEFNRMAGYDKAKKLSKKEGRKRWLDSYLGEQIDMLNHLIDTEFKKWGKDCAIPDSTLEMISEFKSSPSEASANQIIEQLNADISDLTAKNYFELDIPNRALKDYTNGLVRKLKKYVTGNFAASKYDSPSELYEEDYINQRIGYGVGNYALYGKTSNPYIVNANGENWDSIKDDRIADVDLRTREIAKYALKNGYDSVIIKNVYDSGGKGVEIDNESDVYIFFSPEQLKSADPVTYDKSGDVIPLSKRFNSSEKDIRYSDRDPEVQKLNAHLARENMKLKDDVSYLKELMKLQRSENGGQILTRSQIDAAAKFLVKSSESTGDYRELREDLRKFYTKILKSKSLSWEDISRSATPVVDWLQSHPKAKKTYDDNFTQAMEKQALLADVYDSFWRVSTLKVEGTHRKAEINKLKHDHENAMKDLKNARDAETKALKALHRQEMDNLRKDMIRDRNQKIRDLTAGYRADKKAALADQKESAAKKDARAELQKKVLATAKWVAYPPRDKPKCPDFLKKPYLDFLDSIDLSSKQLREGGDPTQNDLRIASTLDSLATAVQNRIVQQDPESENSADDGYLDLPANFAADIRTIAEAFKEITTPGDYDVSRMSSEEIKKLSKIIDTLNQAIRNIDIIYANGRFHSAVKLGESETSFLDSLGELDKDTKTSRFFRWENAVPFYAFKKFGEAGESVFNELMNSQAKLANHAQTIFNFRDKWFKPEELEKWENDVHDITLPSGNVISMTTAQTMSFYLLSKREHAVPHMTGGGIRILGLDKNGKKLADNEAALTVEDINAINRTLDERPRRVAEAIQEFFSTTCSDWGNEISMKRFMTREFTEKDYFPIEVNDENLKQTDPSAQQSDLFRLLNISASKPLTPKANNQLIIRDIFDVFVNHSSDMARLNAFGMELLDIMKWLNYKATAPAPNSEDGFLTNGTAKAMRKAYGSGAKAYVINLIRDINGRPNDTDPTILTKMSKLAKTAAVGNSLRVATLQVTSYPRASLILSPQSLALGLRKMPKYNEAIKYCGIAKWKSFGFYDVNIARNMEEQIKSSQNIRDKLIEWSLKGAEWGDALTIGCLWNACSYEVAKTSSNPVGSEEFKIEVGEKLTEVIYATQVVDSPLTRSQLMRSKNAAVKEASSFMSEPTLSTNILMNAYSQFDIARRQGRTAKAAWAKTKSLITRSAAVYAIGVLMESAVGALWDAWRNEDDDDFRDKYAPAFAENIILEINPASKVPVLADLTSMLMTWVGLGYYSSESLYTSFLGRINNAFKACKSAIEGKGTAYNAIYQTLRAVSSMTGVSVSGPVRELTDFWNNTAGAVDPSLKLLRQSRSRTENASKLLDAYISGKKPDAWEDEFDNDESLKSAVKSEVKKRFTEGSISKDDAISLLEEHAGAENAYWVVDEWESGSEDYSKYDDLFEAVKTGKNLKNTIRDYESRGISKESMKTQISNHFKPIYTTMSKSERARLKGYIRNGLIQTGYDEESVDKKLAQWDLIADIPQRIYTDYLSLTEGLRSKEEKVAVIDSMTISSAEKDALYRSEGWSENNLKETPWH